jgi:hypothetical membrane protein
VTTTRTLLFCGVVGPPLFIVTFLIESATRPGYSWYRNYVSSLATGDGGWLQIANFLVWGTLATLFAIGVVRLGLVAPGILLLLYGAGLIVAGVFVTDPSLGYPPGAPLEHTTHGIIHGLAGLGVFTLNAVAAFAVARHFFGDHRSGAWAIYSLVTGLLIVVLFIASTAVSIQDELGILPNGPTGLLQRISIIVGWTWIAAFAFRLWRDPLPKRDVSLGRASMVGREYRGALRGRAPSQWRIGAASPRAPRRSCTRDETPPKEGKLCQANRDLPTHASYGSRPSQLTPTRGSGNGPARSSPCSRSKTASVARHSSGIARPAMACR